MSRGNRNMAAKNTKAALQRAEYAAGAALKDARPDLGLIPDDLITLARVATMMNGRHVRRYPAGIAAGAGYKVKRLR